MAGRQLSKKGKELAIGPSRDTVVVKQDNAPTMIGDQDCMLTTERNRIPGTSLQRAKCDGKHCVVINPSDESKAYIALVSADSLLGCVEVQRLFCIEDDSLRGFSQFGFKVFMEIFSAVQYVNNKYVGGATSSVGNDNPIQLLPLMLEPNNIFLNGQDQVMLGNFEMKLSDKYIKKNKRNVSQETTRKDVEAANWEEVGNCLSSLCGTYKLSAELNDLLVFLKKGAVMYDDLLWQPGIWDVATKMEFIREIFWILEEERKDKDIEITSRGKRLMKMFSPPKDRNGKQLKIKDDHLLDSVLFLRNKIVAHYDEEYKNFKGSKNEIGTRKETVERYVQKSSPEYMIKLAKTIMELGWIAKSPVMRDENNYMATFFKVKK